MITIIKFEKRGATLLWKYRLKKGFIFLIFILFFGASIFPNITGSIEESNILFNSEICKITNYEREIDFEFIYNLTENLSNIIFTEYNESAGELAKGRAFGTKGEHKAADILYENTTKLGIYTYKEKIENIPNEPQEIAGKIEILERGLLIHNKSSGSKKHISDYYISPRGNLTAYDFYIPNKLNEFKQNRPVIGSILSLLTKIFPPYKNGILDNKYNLYDRYRLSHNFSYTNLEVIRKPSNYSLLKDISRHFINNKPFVYVAKDLSFTDWIKPDPIFKGPFYNSVVKNLPENEKILWTLFQPNCKGVILYDSNIKTYNMGSSDYTPIPTITVNRSIGMEIDKNPNNFKVDFYINQYWNETVESYNIIGQINGTNPNETVVICSLYDSWWCQGTGDAAIGQSIVLGLAKYFADNNIKPKCNVKFIAFGGEEYGFRGAIHYELIHCDEKINYILDLNQVGFKPLIPENIRFQIWTNNESLIPYLEKICKKFNYTERTGTDFVADYKSNGGPSNVKPFAIANLEGKRSCNTLLFVKTGFGFPEPNWLNHHRDGQNHQEGDVLKYYYPEDVKATSDIVLSLLIKFTT